MTHFVGAVLVPNEVTDQEQYLAEVLEKFSEHREVDRYVEYTREQLIAKERTEIEEYRDGRYAMYLADPAGYAKEWMNPQHLAYLSAPESDQSGFAFKLTKIDDAGWLYEEATKCYDAEDIGEDGEVYSTYNPDSRWDWWVVGGRWEDVYRDSQCEPVAELVTVLAETKAALQRGDQLRSAPQEGHPGEEPERRLPWWFPGHLVTLRGDDGEADWIAVCRTGWFGFHDRDMTEAEWIDHLLQMLEGVAAQVVYIDFHN
jgi:hypothetical protein